VQVVANALMLCLNYSHIVPRIRYLIHLERDEIHGKKKATVLLKKYF